MENKNGLSSSCGQQEKEVKMVDNNITFKEIEVSPIRNLCDSFGKEIESSINVEVGESTFKEMEEADNLNDLGLFDKPGILEDRSME